MRRRFAFINDPPISKSDRQMLWDHKGPRPVGHSGLSDLLL
jgi:nuclear transport factor 2 (NTF2) superfamily protein